VLRNCVAFDLSLFQQHKKWQRLLHSHLAELRNLSAAVVAQQGIRHLLLAGEQTRSLGCKTKKEGKLHRFHFTFFLYPVLGSHMLPQFRETRVMVLQFTLRPQRCPFGPVSHATSNRRSSSPCLLFSHCLCFYILGYHLDFN
jgi:hypothetical protein